MIEYTTKDGDVLDLICFQHYGFDIGVTETVLEYNVGLSAHGEVLPAGLVIELPEITAPVAEVEQINLWD